MDILKGQFIRVGLEVSSGGDKRAIFLLSEDRSQVVIELKFDQAQAPESILNGARLKIIGHRTENAMIVELFEYSSETTGTQLEQVEEIGAEAQLAHHALQAVQSSAQVIPFRRKPIQRSA